MIGTRPMLVALALATVATAAGCSNTSTAHPQPEPISWQRCESALTDAITAIRTDRVSALRCAHLSVPLHYDVPDGPTVDIAISRMPASSKHKRGTLLVNPGGPGLEARTLPVMLTEVAGLADWDIIGVDLRGTGASTHPTCTAISDAAPPTSGQITQPDSEARAFVDTITRANRDCTETDGPLLSSLTPRNAAHDLDRVRAALGVDRVSYYGASWGTELGVAYRTLFPHRLDTMVLDSPIYLGTSPDQQNRDLAQAIGRHPHPEEAPPPADEPPADDGPAAETTPQPDTPPAPPLNLFTPAARTAYTCNVLDPEPDAHAQWAAHVAITSEARLPVSTRLPHPANSEIPGASACSGWPTPGQGIDATDTRRPLLIVGHRSETTTPHVWATQAVGRVGGRLLTIEDGAHGSGLGGSCADYLTAFLADQTPPPTTCTPER